MAHGSPYRTEPEKFAEPNARYIRAWRVRRLVGLAALVSVGVGVALRGWSGLIVGVLGVLVFGNWHAMFKCPRCADPLSHWTGSHWSSLAARRAIMRLPPPRAKPAPTNATRRCCVHCGLPFGARRDPDEEE